MSDDHDHFIIPVKYYVANYIALLVLTFFTVYVYYLQLDSISLVVAMAIATVKAMCVVMIFMGLKWEKGYSKVAFFSSFVFVLIFLAFTLTDVFFRDALNPENAEKINLESPVKIVQPGESAHH